jgi:hypothetical protein
VTAAFFRCAYAVPLLAALAWLEKRCNGRAPGATACSGSQPGRSSPPT